MGAMYKLRLHRSSIVFGLVLAVLLVLIVAPGRVGYGAWGARNAGRLYFEHGWPGVYLRREMENPRAAGAARPVTVYVRTGLPRFGIPWLSAENWQWWGADKGRWRFSPWILLGDVLAGACVVAVGTWMWEWRRRRRPRLLSFGLAEILVVMTVAGLVLGWVEYQKREFKREEALRQGGQETRHQWLADGTLCVAPRWLQSLTGPAVYPDFLWRPWRATVSVYKAGEEAEPLRAVSQLKHLREIYLFGFGVPVDYGALRRLDRLECLLVAQPMSDEQIEQLAQFRRLRKLVLMGGSPGPEGVTREELAVKLQKKMPWCEVVDYLTHW
jgi:hypothetical protein